MAYRMGLVGLALTGCALTAHADTFSAYSDRNPDGPTFAGGLHVSGLDLVDGRPFDANGMITFGLGFDLNDDAPGGDGFVATRFEFSGSLREYQRIFLGGGLVQHTYRASGDFHFLEQATGTMILMISFRDGIFSSVSNNPDAWGQTATLVSDDTIDPGITFTPGSFLAGRNLTLSEDFAFGLSNVRSHPSGARVGVTSAGAPVLPWKAEASFVAHAIPAPSALGLLAMAGGLAARRRR